MPEPRNEDTPLPASLRPHTRAGRLATARALVPLWRRTFGDAFLAVAATGSVARGDDRDYSDLELVVFLAGPVPEGEDPYLQRVVGGLLVEAEYTTEEAYVERYATAVDAEWFLAGSAPLVPLHNAALVERVAARVAAARHDRAAFLRRAARRFLEAREAFGKVLNALDEGNGEGLPLLLFDAVVHTLVMLSFVNERPFTTFARFVAEARAFRRKPARLDEILDRVVAGRYHDFAPLRSLVLAVVADLERLLVSEGAAFDDATLDPGVPNRRFSG